MKLFFEYVTVVAMLLVLSFWSCGTGQINYVCEPCDRDCDTMSFKKPGVCPHCNMKLLDKDSLEAASYLVLNEISIKEGTGKFLIDGGLNKEEREIVVHYFSPESLNTDSKIIIVLPGAGRNGDDYRDAWISMANKYNLLVLALEYPEQHYPELWNYNLAGMIENVNLQLQSFDLVSSSTDWIFGDFDRIFGLVSKNLGLSQNTYDLFGHSAGGQILHRHAIFQNNTKANNIVAANSGWYTVPEFSSPFPYGLKNGPLTSDGLNFNQKLIILLGEKDDSTETRGHLRRSPEVDIQGLGRLSRGIYFYEKAKTMAANKSFNWKLKLVPNVGHDYLKMSEAAANYLYNKDQ